MGDGDSLDICVLSERPITAREILLNAKIIGGLTMLDGGEADDKIIAVLANDFVWGEVEDIAQLPKVLVERLRHYFSTDKLLPDTAPLPIVPYDKQHAHEVVLAAMADQQDVYGET